VGDYTYGALGKGAQWASVPQLDNLDETLTVEQNLRVFAHLYRVPRGERRRGLERALGRREPRERRTAKVKELSAACAGGCSSPARSCTARA
jgi:ABC-type lipoprotein export system ATPase subunit